MKKHYVSDYWNKGIKGHLYYDFIDVVVNDDNLLFIDPLLIEIAGDKWCQEANAAVKSFQETRKHLNSVPGRFGFVFTPTHGSWLNMVEGFFSKMTKQMLNGIRGSGKEELAERIYKYFDEINQVPVPYRWSYNLDDQQSHQKRMPNSNVFVIGGFIRRGIW